MLTKEQIRAAKDMKREWVAIEGWTPEGETFDATKHGVYVGTMSTKQRDKWESQLIRAKSSDAQSNDRNYRASLVVFVTQDADGNRFFDDADVQWLNEKGATSIDTLFEAAMRINKLRKEDRDSLVMS